jgi:hypothetical protein
MRSEAGIDATLSDCQKNRFANSSNECAPFAFAKVERTEQLLRMFVESA